MEKKYNYISYYWRGGVLGIGEELLVFYFSFCVYDFIDYLCFGFCLR